MKVLDTKPEIKKGPTGATPYWEASEHLNTLPSSRERIDYALNVPLVMTTADYDVLPANRPTPLDTKWVWVSGDNKLVVIPDTEPVRYHDFAIQMAGSIAEVVSDMQPHDICAEAYYAEIVAQIENRCAHNQKAFERLKVLLQQDDTEGDIADVLMRLRAGKASLAEMYEVIQRYPAMGAIQTSNYMRFFDVPALTATARQAMLETARLGYLKQDVTIKMDQLEHIGLSDSAVVEGIKVQKMRIGHLIQGDSDIEHMLKIVYIPTKDGFEPCAVSTYLRPASYKDYADYEHETIDNFPVTVDELELDDTARMLEGSARDEYLRALYGAVQKHNSLHID